MNEDNYEEIEVVIDEDEKAEVVLIEPIVDYLLSNFQSDLKGVIYDKENFDNDLERLLEIYFNNQFTAFENYEFLHLSLDVLLYGDLTGHPVISKADCVFVFQDLFSYAQNFLKSISEGVLEIDLYDYGRAKKLKNFYLKLMLIKSTLGLEDRFSVDSEARKPLYFVDTHLSDLLKKLYRK